MSKSIHRIVKDSYSKIAQDPRPASTDRPSCCGGDSQPALEAVAARLGYGDEADDLHGLANLGLGCGNPQALADLNPGETVLDLGAGAGFDSFLAARAVAPDGFVIGVDMTEEMLARARANATKLGLKNVEFRQGQIEAIPVKDELIDVILSNCVINLSPDKLAVFREAWRVLRPGGRLAISDVVAREELPQAWRGDPDLIAACIGNASPVEQVKTWLQEAGFIDISITEKGNSDEIVGQWAPDSGAEARVFSADIRARKPS